MPVRHRGHRVVDRHDAHARLGARGAAVDAAAIGGRQVARDGDRQRERLASRRVDVGEAAAADAADRRRPCRRPAVTTGAAADSTSGVTLRATSTPSMTPSGPGGVVGQTIARPSQCSTARSRAGSSPATGSGSRSPSASANERTAKPGSPSTANADPATNVGPATAWATADTSPTSWVRAAVRAAAPPSVGRAAKLGGRDELHRQHPSAHAGPCSGRSPRSRHGRSRARRRRCRPRCGRRCARRSGRRPARRTARRRGWRARSRRRPPRPPAWFQPVEHARPLARSAVRTDDHAAGVDPREQFVVEPALQTGRPACVLAAQLGRQVGQRGGPAGLDAGLGGGDLAAQVGGDRVSRALSVPVRSMAPTCNCTSVRT